MLRPLTSSTVEDKIYFDPQKNITRAGLAELIYNAYQYKNYTAEEAINENEPGSDPEENEPVPSQIFKWELLANQGSSIIAVPANGIKIVSITSQDPIKKGVENVFLVKVKYDLTTYDQAVIDIPVLSSWNKLCMDGVTIPVD